MARKSAGEIYIDYRAGTAIFNKDMEGVLTKVAAIGATLGNVLGTGITAGARQLYEMTAHVVTLGHEMGLAAQKAGLSIEAFSGLRYAAKMADVNTESFTGAMGKLGKSMMAAASGGESGKNAFTRLGVSVKDSAGHLRAGDEVLADLAEKFAKMPDGAMKTALSLQVFGKAGANIVPMLNLGRDGMRAYREEAERLGLVMTEKTARQSEQFVDSLKRLQGALEGVGVAIAAGILPPLSTAAKQIGDMALGSGAAKTAGEGLGEMLRVVVVNATVAATALTEVFVRAKALSGYATGVRPTMREATMTAIVTGKPKPMPSGGLSGQWAEDSAVLQQMWQDTYRKLDDIFNNYAPHIQTSARKVGDSLSVVGKAAKQAIPPFTDLEKAFDELRKKLIAVSTAGSESDKFFAELPKVVAPERLREMTAEWAKINETVSKSAFWKSISADMKVSAEEMQKFAAEVTASLKTEGSQFYEYLSKIEAAMAGGKLNELTGKVAFATKVLGRGTGANALPLDRLLDDLGKENKAVSDAAREARREMVDLGRTIGSVFEDALLKMDNFGGMLKSIGEDVLRLIIRLQVTYPLTQALVGAAAFNPGATPGGLLGKIAGLFAGGAKAGGGLSFDQLLAQYGGMSWGLLPGFARGGDVSAGRPIIVGESGRELFVPKVDGRIFPREAAGATVINNVDARGADPAVEYRVLRAIKEAMRQSKIAGQAEIIDRARRMVCG